jgi:molybdate transport system substrate-binding protein
VTDARAAAGRVTAIAIRESVAAVNTYRIALTRDAANPADGRRFIELVTGPTGREILRRAGFGPA